MNLKRFVPYRNTPNEELPAIYARLQHLARRVSIIDIAIFIALLASAPHLTVGLIFGFGGSTTLPAVVLFVFAAYEAATIWWQVKLGTIEWRLQHKWFWRIVTILLNLYFVFWLLHQAIN